MNVLCSMVPFWDDPVSASATHGIGGIWGMIAVGLFAKKVLAHTFGKSVVLLYTFSIELDPYSLADCV